MQQALVEQRGYREQENSHLEWPNQTPVDSHSGGLQKVLNSVILASASKCSLLDYSLRKTIPVYEVGGQGQCFVIFFPPCIKHRVWHIKCLKKPHLQND